MRSKSEKKVLTQGGVVPSGLEKVRQLLMPLVAGMAATKADLMEWVQGVGLEALKEVFEADALAIAGEKGKHLRDREHHRWGTTETELPFGGRRIRVERPRVRKKSGGEVQLPSVRRFQEEDPIPERVVNQILLGVTTRGYGRSLEALPPGVKGRGVSKSAASRHLVARMGSKVRDYLSASLENVDLLVMMLDGIEVGGETVVVAIGVTVDGTKIPLGLIQGSTENGAICTSLLHDLLSRDLKVEEKILCVIDGGKGIRKALEDVFGDRALIHRCHLHKRRNLKDHLPKKVQLYVDRLLREAYGSTSADVGRKRLRSLISWLEGNGYEDAASSLREGLEETLTLLKLDLPPRLRSFLATTNAIENTMSTVRRVTRNVKRWKDGGMIRRWTAIGLMEAQRKFRRIRGYRELPKLVAALRTKSAGIEKESVA
jgi:transposase-like protein